MVFLDMFVVSTKTSLLIEMQRKGIGLDFDGTILNSLQRHTEALRSVYPKIDDVSLNWEQEFLNYKRKGLSTLDYLRSHNISEADNIVIKWVEIIESPSLLSIDCLYSGAYEALQRLAEFFDLYLATARTSTCGAIEQLDKYDLTAFFKSIYVVKPGRRAGQHKADCFEEGVLQYVVGDTESDQEWAERCSAEFIPLSSGFRDVSFWTLKGAYPSAHLRDIPARLGL